MDHACTYCGSDVRRHDPVFVSEGPSGEDPVGRFCNYACLDVYIDEEALTVGAACEWPC